jgi:hypothetical protein
VAAVPGEEGGRVVSRQAEPNTGSVGAGLFYYEEKIIRVIIFLEVGFG